MSDETVEKAKSDASVARTRLFATVQELQVRLEPSNVLDDVVTDVRERSVRAARTASDTVRARPAAFGAAAVVGALLLGHRPLVRHGRRLFGRSDERRDDETEDAAAS